MKGFVSGKVRQAILRGGPPRHESGTVKLSRTLGVWRRNRSALECRINNLGSVQGAEEVLESVNLTVPSERHATLPP